MSDAMLALPSGEVVRPRNLLSLGAALAGTASLMAVASLIAAYLSVRSQADAWPPKGLRIDNYLGAMITLTALMTSFLVEWGAAAVRRGLHRQALAALSLTLLMGLAWLNGVWYLGSQLGFGVARHAYAGVAYAIIGVSGLCVLAALGVVGVGLARVAGRQQGPGDDQVVRAGAWYWQFAVLAWVCAYSTLFLVK